MPAQASAADVDHIDLMLINRRIRPLRANLRPHAKLDSVHLLQSNVPEDVDELDIMRPRPSPRHCAKTKLQSPLQDLHNTSTSRDLQGTLAVMVRGMRGIGASEAGALASHQLSVHDGDTNDSKKKSPYGSARSTSPDIAEMPGASPDKFEPIELDDFVNWNVDGRINARGGIKSQEASLEALHESSGPHAADRMHEHVNTRVQPFSCHETRLLTNMLTGFDLHLEHNVGPSGFSLRPLRRDHGMLAYTRRPPVMRARSSFNADLMEDRIHRTRQAAGIFPTSLRAVHNRSIGQEIIASLAKDPALESTTSTLLECAQLLRV